MGVSGTFHLKRILGIDLFLHWSWFLIAVVEIQLRAGVYSFIGWNILEYLTLFLIVTLHEFGHALACRSVGGEANRIVLWPLGGIAYVDPPQRAGAMLWSITAGPLVNVVLAPLLWFIAFSVRTPAWIAADPNFVTYLQAVAWINTGLLVFNLIPVYPLDGGQILRSLLWYPLGRARSLMISTVVGFAGVAVLGFIAFRTSDLWLGAIAIFIVMNCWTGLRHAWALSQRAKLPRQAGFRCPWCEAAPLDGAYWRCGHCGQAVNPFATAAGACPACSVPLKAIPCTDCGRAHALPAWNANTIPATARPLTTAPGALPSD